MIEKKMINWERVELDYRSGIKTLREIADEQGITHGAINKRAKRDGWVRDLTAKIKARVILNKGDSDPFDSSGFIYVIYLDDSASERYFKIGMASSFTSRFSHHQCSSPFDICVACVYFVNNMRLEEKSLHSLFKDNRVKGEWFQLSEDDLRAISSRALLI